MHFEVEGKEVQPHFLNGQQNYVVEVKWWLHLKSSYLSRDSKIISINIPPTPPNITYLISLYIY